MPITLMVVVTLALAVVLGKKLREVENNPSNVIYEKDIVHTTPDDMGGGGGVLPPTMNTEILVPIKNEDTETDRKRNTET